MAHTTPQFNIKTGSDSQLFFSREVTAGDVNAEGSTYLEDGIGRIKTGDIEQDCDVFSYPQLTRRTGHSIAGSTESIESQELRKGRTKSAPRKGNSSSEGSLDIELSPQTYDDIFEAALRNKWKNWTSDNTSAIKFDYEGTLGTDQFISHGTTEDGELASKYLVGWKGASDDRKNAIVMFEDEAERNTFEIAELTCGTEDIKYSALAQYGGITGEDLYQEFQHLAVNTMSLSVSPGQIVTGSFGFMGSNNPDLLDEGQAYTVADPQPTSTTFADGTYYTLAEGVYTKATTFNETTATGKGYYVAPEGIIEALADDTTRSKEGRFYKTDDAGEKIVGMTPAEVKAWVDDLANKTGTSTDQFTAREGFLYINGHRVQYGSNLTFELNNGLKQIFAIFEKGAISTAPMSLDITGTLDAYLIKGHTEDLYNMCSGDKDVEITFCFQDQEDNPNDLYVMQIFKAKFTGNQISQGTEELTVSLPFQSFEERACRFFRIRKRQVKTAVISSTKKVSDTEIDVELTSPQAAKVADGDINVTATFTSGDTTKDLTVAFVAGASTTSKATYKLSGFTDAGTYDITIKAKYNGIEYTKKYESVVIAAD